MRICMHDHDYVMDFFYLMVMLRSTMGPYRWPVIDVAYKEMILSLHWGCTGDDSSERVVEVSAWCIVHVWHTRVNTNVDTVYIKFWFSKYKNLYICILFSKSICSIKNTSSLWPCPGPMRFKQCFSTAHKF